jgi:hypothetical protein
MELVVRISNLTKQANEIKEEINLLISSLPDNPDIKRINDAPNCFIVQFSTIQKDKTHVLCPCYYDFKYQYKKLIEKINQADILTLDKTLLKITNEGSFKLYTGTNIHGQACNDTIKLHPLVITKLKELI